MLDPTSSYTSSNRLLLCELIYVYIVVHHYNFWGSHGTPPTRKLLYIHIPWAYINHDLGFSQSILDSSLLAVFVVSSLVLVISGSVVVPASRAE